MGVDAVGAGLRGGAQVVVGEIALAEEDLHRREPPVAPGAGYAEKAREPAA